MLMTPAQEGAYIRLLCIAWNDADCSLPDNDEELARLSRLGEGWFKGGSTILRDCFEKHPRIAGRIINSKLFLVKKKQLEWRKKSSAGGLKSAETRRNGGKGGSTNGQAKSKHSGTNQTSTPTDPDPREIHISPSSEIFAYWQAATNHPKAKFTPERRARVSDRLKDGYTVDEIKQAIDGCVADPFHRGENQDGKVWDDLELICRTGSKLEGLAALAPEVPKQAPPKPAEPEVERMGYEEYQRRKAATTGNGRAPDSAQCGSGESDPGSPDHEIRADDDLPANEFDGW